MARVALSSAGRISSRTWGAVLPSMLPSSSTIVTLSCCLTEAIGTVILLLLVHPARRRDPDLHCSTVSARGQLNREPERIEVRIFLSIHPALFDEDTAGRQDVRGHPEHV